jgi:hypothetical protein
MGIGEMLIFGFICSIVRVQNYKTKMIDSVKKKDNKWDIVEVYSTKLTSPMKNWLCI